MPDTTASRMQFRKSSYSSPRGQDCVEIADTPRFAAVRDSQHPDQGHLEFSIDAWSAFLTEVKAGGL
ncbi:DUF397 domain-containing protein [Streptomonospora sediminis]